MNKRFMKAVINKEYSLIKCLEDLSVVPKGSLFPERTCYCPFHDNTESKAAKIYDDPKGITLFCFAEQKSYRSSDAIEVFAPESFESIFEGIWNALSIDQQAYYLDNFDSDSDVISDEWKETLEKLKGFKQRKLTYADVKSIILKTVEKAHGGES